MPSVIRTTLDEAYEVVETVSQVVSVCENLEMDELFAFFDLLDPGDDDELQVAINPLHIVSVKED